MSMHYCLKYLLQIDILDWILHCKVMWGNFDDAIFLATTRLQVVVIPSLMRFFIVNFKHILHLVLVFLLLTLNIKIPTGEGLKFLYKLIFWKSHSKDGKIKFPKITVMESKSLKKITMNKGSETTIIQHCIGSYHTFGIPMLYLH